MKARVRSAVLIILLLGVVVAFFSDVLIGDRVLITCNTRMWLPWAEYATPQELDQGTYRTDAARTYLPRRAHAQRSIASGRFPLWNPYILGGSPFFADPQTGVLYPIGMVLFTMDAIRSLGYDVAVHFFLAMLGMFLFLGMIGTNLAGRMFGALAYGLSSFFFLRMGHPTFVAAAAWLPYIFFAYERSKHTVRCGVLLLMVFLSLGYLAGMPQVFMFGVGALLIYTLLDSFEFLIRHDPRMALRNLKVFFLASGLALLAIGIQLVPFVEFARNSQGMGFTLEAMSKDHLWQPIFLLRTIIPDFFGNPVQGTNWIGLVKGAVHPYNSGFMVYCGVGGLSLGLAALVFLRRSRHTRMLFGLLILSLVAGTSAVGLRILYAVFPPVAYSQIDRVSVVACFALAALAGKGISLAARMERTGLARRFTLVPIMVAILMACGLVVFNLTGEDMLTGLAQKGGRVIDETWFRSGGFRLIEWLRQDGRDWFEYERWHLGLGVVFAAVTALWVWLYVGTTRHIRSRKVAAWLLGLTLAFDLGLAARRYYVTQPPDCLGKTEGIEVLSGLLADNTRWRMGHLGVSDWVLPMNTPQIYGMPSLGGVNAMYPSGHVDRVALTAALRRAGPEPPVPLSPVGDLMCVRYLVADRSYPGLTDSPMMEVLMEADRLCSKVSIVSVDGERRLALSLRPGESCSLNVAIPDCDYLGFSLAVGGDARGGGDVSSGAMIILTGADGRKASLELEGLSEAAGRWRDFRLDVSHLAGGRAGIVFRVTGDEADSGGSVAWSRFEWVKCDCEIVEVRSGYEIDTAGLDGTFALEFEGTGEFPVRIGNPDRPGEYVTRFVRFDHAGGSAYILVALAPSVRTVVVSPEDFRLVRARLIDTGGATPSGLVPVYDGDMFIYENLSALPRGICVGTELFAGYDRSLEPPGVLPLGGVVGRLGSHMCGQVSILSYRDDRLTAEVEADRDGLLLIQDTWYPGWSARVDGVETPVLRTDLGIRAVPVRGGRHRVILAYAPGSVRLGLVLSILGITLGVVYGAKAKEE